MPMPRYLRNLDGTAGKPRLSEGTMLSEGPVNDCMSDSPAMSCVRRRLLELKSTASMPENLSGGDGSGDENRE